MTVLNLKETKLWTQLNESFICFTCYRTCFWNYFVLLGLFFGFIFVITIVLENSGFPDFSLGPPVAAAFAAVVVDVVVVAVAASAWLVRAAPGFHILRHTTVDTNPLSVPGSLVSAVVLAALVFERLLHAETVVQLPWLSYAVISVIQLCLKSNLVVNQFNSPAMDDILRHNMNSDEVSTWLRM